MRHPNISEFNLDLERKKDPNYNRYNAQYNYNQNKNIPYGNKYDRKFENCLEQKPDHSPLMQHQNKLPTPQSYQDYAPVYGGQKFNQDSESPGQQNFQNHNPVQPAQQKDHLDGFYEKYVKQKPDEELHVRREKFFDKLSYLQDRLRDDSDQMSELDMIKKENELLEKKKLDQKKGSNSNIGVAVDQSLGREEIHGKNPLNLYANYEEAEGRASNQGSGKKVDGRRVYVPVNNPKN